MLRWWPALFIQPLTIVLASVLPQAMFSASARAPV